jgi:uncharacterized protein YjbJ (UPF0337 family)
MIYRVLLPAFLVANALAGSVELVSGDLSSATRSLDNIKGKWSQNVGKAKLTAEYDRNAKKDFLSEASLSGSLDRLDYEVSTSFGDSADVKLATTTDDGTKLEAEGSVSKLVGSVRKLTASRAAKLRDQAVDLELSHDVPSSTSKVRLSSVLGSGVTAVGAVSTCKGESSMDYEFEYETKLTEGRVLSASVAPAKGTGEIEYEDSATLDATITATFPMGGEPRVTVKRGFSF